MRMYECFGLKKEIIIILISYCCNINKTSIAYMEKIAFSWAENNINTPKQAQEEVQHLTSLHEYINKVMRILKVDRLAVSHEKMIKQWKNTNITNDMINYAYELTMKKFKEINFKYLDNIILNWHKKGFTDLKDVKENEELHE